MTNIFSKLEEDEVASIQILIRPRKDRKWQKKTEQAGVMMFSGKKPGGFRIPGLSFLGDIVVGIFFGYDKIQKNQQQAIPHQARTVPAVTSGCYRPAKR